MHWIVSALGVMIVITDCVFGTITDCVFGTGSFKLRPHCQRPLMDHHAPKKVLSARCSLVQHRASAASKRVTAWSCDCCVRSEEELDAAVRASSGSSRTRYLAGHCGLHKQVPFPC